MSARKTNFGKYLIKAFFQGLVILGPISVTLAVIYYVFTSMDDLFPVISEKIPGLTFVILVIIVTVVGIIGTRFLVGRYLVDALGNLLENTPGVKYIYTAIKDVLVSFVGDKKKFNNPVWVRTSTGPEIWRIGFLTQNDLSFAEMEGKISVYLPHSYAISGWVIITDPVNIKEVKGMNAAEAMKFAVSGGVTGKEQILSN